MPNHKATYGGKSTGSRGIKKGSSSRNRPAGYYGSSNPLVAKYWGYERSLAQKWRDGTYD